MEDETMWTAREYCENLGTLHIIDVIKAIALYSIYMLILLIQGFTYTTNLSVDILNLSYKNLSRSQDLYRRDIPDSLSLIGEYGSVITGDEFFAL